MGKNQEKNSAKSLWIVVGLITFLGLGLRLLCCLWGIPLTLHADEHTIIDNAIDMLQRHSWEAYVYNRPDQFEIKCCAVIFEVASRLVFHMPAYVAFPDHFMFFYVLGRAYTAFFGAMLIPLSVMLIGKMFDKEKGAFPVRACQILTAAFMSFSWIMIQQSAYATPDIVLTFFVELIALLSLYYLDNGDVRLVYVMAICLGISISIKYPAAIMTLYIALVVIYKQCKSADKKNRVKRIVGLAVACAFIAFFVVFFMAPNLITDLNSTITTFKTEARSTHLGADGLGFFGNLRFYLTTACNSVGILSLIPFGFGIAYLSIYRRMEHVALLINGIYWVILSKLALHWLRWGVPMYPAYYMMVAIGTVWMFVLIRRKIKNVLWKKLAVASTGVVCLVFGVNFLLSGLTLVVYTSRTDVRVQGIEVLEDAQVTMENSICESYTTYTPAGGGGVALWDCFDMKGETLSLKPDFQGKQYFVMSTGRYGRFKAEAERYAEELSYYQLLDEQYERVVTLEGWEYETHVYGVEISNIKKNVEFLMNQDGLTGYSTYVYSLE